MEVLLDSSFIITCIKRKIDFISQLEEQGFRVLLPREVFQELKDLKLRVSHDDRAIIDIALKVFESKKIKKMKLGNDTVDKGLIAKGKQGFYIASLDSSIRREVKNKVGILSSGNRIFIERV